MKENSYEVSSDERNATLQLSKDLYRVSVSYLQRTVDRRVVDGGSLSINPRKQLL